MARTIVYLKKSNRPGKKYMVWVDGKTVHFGAAGMSDYTKHHDTERMKRYTARHKRGGETWGKSGIKTAGFWSKWLLWNKKSIGASKRDIASKYNVTFKSGWPSKGAKGGKGKARKSKRKSRKARKSKRKSRKARKSKSRKARKSKRKSRSRFSVRRKGEKYERCVLAVKSKQARKCQKKGGKGCKNPFAICTASVGRYN